MPNFLILYPFERETLPVLAWRGESHTHTRDEL